MSLENLVKSIQDIMRKDVGVDGDAQRISQMVWLLFLKILDDREEEWELRDDYRSPIPSRFRWRNWAANPEGITGEELIDFVNTELFPKLKTLVASSTDRRALVIRSVFEDGYNYMKNGTLLRQVINKIQEDIDYNTKSQRHLLGEIYEKILRDLQSAGNAGEYYTPRAVTEFMVQMVNPQLDETVLDPACGTGGFLTCTIEHKRPKARTPAEERVLQESLRGVEKKPLPHMLATTNMLLHGIEDPSFIKRDNMLSQPLRDYGVRDEVDCILTNPPFGGMEEDGIESNFPQQFRTRETADLFLALIVKLLKPGGRAGVVLPDSSLSGDEGVKRRIKENLLLECNLHTIVRLPHGVFNPYTGIKTNLLFFTKGEPTKTVWFYEHPYPPGVKNYSKTAPIDISEFKAEAEWWRKDTAAGRSHRKETPFAWQVTLADIVRDDYNLDVKNPNAKETMYGDPDELLATYKAIQTEVDLAGRALRDEILQTAAHAADRSASAAVRRVTDNFEVFTRSPLGVSTLRQAMRQLAVRGRLSVHDPADEPASILLERIKSQLSHTPESCISSEEDQDMRRLARRDVIYVPPGWARTPLGGIVDFNYGKGLPANRRSEDGAFPVYGANGVLGRCDTPLVNVPCIIVGRKGSAGAINRSDGPSWPSDVAYYVVPPDGLDFDYAELLLRSLDLEGLAKGIKPGLNRKKAYRLRCMLPPLPEQRRIVAKVRDLMELCDTLEAKLTQFRHDTDVTLAAIAYHLINPATDAHVGG
jgi:type I restriction enzyme M protein